MVKLPRLATGWDKQPQLFERYWNEAMSTIEANIDKLLQLPIIQEQVQAVADAAENAQTAADTANAAADTANAAASAITSESSLVNSYPSGFTVPLISADSLGNITIANHSRVYGNSALNPTVAVTGATITTGATPGQIIRIYYSDPAKIGGSVSYLYTVDPTPPIAQTGNYHSVGAVEIPVSSSAPGKELGPPGYINYF